MEDEEDCEAFDEGRVVDEPDTEVPEVDDACVFCGKICLYAKTPKTAAQHIIAMTAIAAPFRNLFLFLYLVRTDQTFPLKNPCTGAVKCLLKKIRCNLVVINRQKSAVENTYNLAVVFNAVLS